MPSTYIELMWSRATHDGSGVVGPAAYDFDANGASEILYGDEERFVKPCTNRLEMLVRTASDAYFAQVVSALRLKEPAPQALVLKLREKDVWKAVQKVTSVEQLQMLASLQDLVKSAIAGESLEEVLRAIQKERGSGGGDDEPPLRSAEYRRFLTAPDELPGVLPRQGVEFAAYRVPDARADLPRGIARLVLVPELREVRVQVSFSRFDSVNANLEGRKPISSAGSTSSRGAR